jgi:hypothetical protein
MLCARDGARHARAHAWVLDLSDDLSQSLRERTHEEYVAGLACLLERERNGGAVADPDKFRVFEAYFAFLHSERRIPLIGELLEMLDIDKPKLAKDNRQEWEKVNNRERVIRKTLEKAGLHLQEGKRGRRW